MISVSKAEQIILGSAKPVPVESCPLKQAYGRVLREDIYSDRDQPPFDKALMDGIGISYAAWQKGAREFPIEQVIVAGRPPAVLKDKTSCMQIMTGGVMPKGCDCVVPIEQIKIDGEMAHLNAWVAVKPRQFVRLQGADAKKGSLFLRKGTRLNAPQIAVAASVGAKQLKVSKLPSIAIIATGDELIEIAHPIKVHQTRLSNSYALQALFTQSGLAKAAMFHLPDNKKTLQVNIRRIIDQHDIIVLSGGVSMGEFDFVPQVLSELKVTQLFHKVAQKPGGPFWFGLTKSGKPVFALPGNPASTLVCAYRYAMPYLIKASGFDFKKETMVLKEQPAISSDLTHFLPVKRNAIVPTGGSGDFAAWATADGFIEYDNNIRQSSWSYFSWRT